MRERVFSDQVVLFSGGRLAFLFLILGIVSIFSGVDNVVREQYIRPRIALKIFEQAQADFKDKNFGLVISKCKELLKSNPKNGAVLALLANSYWALGQHAEAEKVYMKLLDVNPDYSLKKASPKKSKSK